MSQDETTRVVLFWGIVVLGVACVLLGVVLAVGIVKVIQARKENERRKSSHVHIIGEPDWIISDKRLSSVAYKAGSEPADEENAYASMENVYWEVTKDDAQHGPAGSASKTKRMAASVIVQNGVYDCAVPDVCARL